MLVNTPYDDVFKTLAVDCRNLLIPLINEGFGEHFTGDEQIVFYPNEHLISQPDGREQERIADTCFEIQGAQIKKYHIECQSTADASMLMRMFEYDTQIALDSGTVERNVLKVQFPNSAVFYLRSNDATPDAMYVQMITPAGELSYPIRVIKMKSYTLQEIFIKKLFFLIPFYIFIHEKNFAVYNKDTDRLHDLLEEYENIRNHLERLTVEGILDEFTRQVIIAMTKKVVEHLAKKYTTIQKGVSAVMGGKVLEYEAKTIRNSGLQEGLREGLQQGRKEGMSLGLEKGKILTYAEMIYDGFISINETAARLNMSVEKLQELINEYL